MKNLIITLVAASSMLTPTMVHAQTESAASLHKKGVAAEAAGEADAAKAFYTAALKVDPNSADARYSLGQLKIHFDKVAARGREAKLGAVLIPVFQLDEATLPDALRALGDQIEEQSKGEVAPNFIIEDPTGKLKGKTASLNLKNMPVKAVLKYVLDQIGAKARYDEHAVVILPR